MTPPQLPYPPMPPPPPLARRVWPGSVFLGLLLSFVIQLVAGTIGYTLSLSQTRGFAFTMFSWGVGQWALVLPLHNYFNSQGQVRTATGLLVLALLGFMLSSLCGGIGLMM